MNLGERNSTNTTPKCTISKIQTVVLLTIPHSRKPKVRTRERFPYYTRSQELVTRCMGTQPCSMLNFFPCPAVGKRSKKRTRPVPLEIRHERMSNGRGAYIFMHAIRYTAPLGPEIVHQRTVISLNWSNPLRSLCCEDKGGYFHLVHPVLV
jgi:hypothetical protein